VGGANHLHPAGGEQVLQAVKEKRVIVGKQDAHFMSSISLAKAQR
jgi:hypothetical protein